MEERRHLKIPVWGSELFVDVRKQSEKTVAKSGVRVSLVQVEFEVGTCEPPKRR